MLLSLSAAAWAEGQDNAAPPPSISFEGAVRAALTKSHEVRLAGQDTRITAEGKTRAQAGRFPRLDASSDYTTLTEPPSAFILGMPIQTADKSIWRARVVAEQTIFDFGRTRSRVDQAQARVEAAEKVEGLTRERQALDVISVFLAARRGEESLAIAAEALGGSRRVRSRARRRPDARRIQTAAKTRSRRDGGSLSR